MRSGRYTVRIAAVVVFAWVVTAAIAVEKITCVAVGPFFAPGHDQQLVNFSEALPELLTAELSSNARFHVLERQQMHAVLKELDLSSAGMIDAASILKLGKLISADWLLSGSVITTTNQSQIWIKVIDMHSGVVRDFAAVPYVSANVTATITTLADFVDRARTASAKKQFIALGSIVDLSIKGERPDLSRHIQMTIERHCHDNGLGIAERDAVAALLQEHQLDGAGLTALTNAPAKIEHAFWFVDGFCRWMQDKLLVTLRVQKVGFKEQQQSVVGAPGPGLDQQVLRLLQGCLAATNLVALEKGRGSEADIHAGRGWNLARANDPLPETRLGSKPRRTAAEDQKLIEEEMEQKAANRRRTIQRLESAVLLNPKDLDSKHTLGIALFACGGADRERGRQILEEFVRKGPEKYQQSTKEFLDRAANEANGTR